MKTFKCDRCGTAYQPPQWHPDYTLSKRLETNRASFVYIDLCPDCYEKLCDWLENGSEGKAT